ncbi:MAG: HAD-IA family hydrolase [Clostridiales bacterium]|nr:HAD-IA family hydrolase [Clostridiales bacterium]
MNYQTILFDLDGTLLNTLDDLHTACNYALTAVGEPPRSREEVRRFVGNGIGTLLARAIPGGTDHPRYGEALALLQSYYRAHDRVNTAPYEGVLPLLDALTEAGYRLGVVSNKPDGPVKALCRAYFGDRIAVAIGDRPRFHRKPAPDAALEALRALGADPDSALYVGDSDVDIATARNAGLPCLSVTWGFRDREVLLAAGATALADSPQEVLAFLQGETLCGC